MYKTKNLWQLLSLLGVFGCLLAFTACSDDEKETVPPVMSFETNSVTLAGKGETVTLNYSVTDAPAGFLLPEATVSADWVRVADHSTLGQITLEVDAAPLDMEGRTAQLILTLPEFPTVQATCTLTQGKNEEAFYIEITDLQANGVIYRITASDQVGMSCYTALCFPAEQEATFGDDPKTALLAYRERIRGYRDQGLTTWANVGPRGRDPERDGYEWREIEKNLKPGTRYCLMAFGCKGSFYTFSSLKYVTPLTKLYFTTPTEQEPVQPATLQMETRVRGVMLDAHIKPSRSDVWTYARCVTQEELGEVKKEIGAIEEMYYRGSSYDYLLSYMHQGDYAQENVNTALSANTDYTFLVMAYDRYLNRLSDWYQQVFRTTTALPSDITFQVDFQDDHVAYIHYVIQPSNNDTFAWVVRAAEEIEGMSEEELQTLFYNQQSGKLERKAWACPGDEYVVLVAGNAGKEKTFTTPIYKFPHKIADAIPSEDVSMSIDWYAKVDGTAYADANPDYAYLSGKDVLFFHLNYHPGTEIIYYQSFNPGVEDWLKEQVYINIVAHHVISNNFPYYRDSESTPYPQTMGLVYSKGKTGKEIMLFVPFAKEWAKMGQFYLLEIDHDTLPYTSVEEFEKLVGGSASTTRMTMAQKSCFQPVSQPLSWLLK